MLWQGCNMKKAIAYYRVSTDRQGKSGLGLEAQAEAVSRFAAQEGYQIEAEFTEVESRKKNKRPQLLAALAQCKKHRAMLIIAKLDRLSGKVAFISNLMESKVDFKVVDNPHATKFMVHMLAAYAEHEREQISIRTKDALGVAKRRGVQLGKYGKEVLSKINAATAADFAAQMQPIIQEIKAEGFTTVRAICAELNQRQIPTLG